MILQVCQQFSPRFTYDKKDILSERGHHDMDHRLRSRGNLPKLSFLLKIYAVSIFNEELS